MYGRSRKSKQINLNKKWNLKKSQLQNAHKYLYTASALNMENYHKKILHFFI